MGLALLDLGESHYAVFTCYRPLEYSIGSVHVEPYSGIARVRKVHMQTGVL